jgi:hypothetical protein
MERHHGTVKCDSAAQFSQGWCFSKLNTLPSAERCSRRSKFHIGKDGIGINQNNFGTFGKNAKHCGNFVRKPDVVLVTEKDDVPCRKADSGFKITAVTESLLISDDSDSVRALVCDLRCNVEGPVCRTVVAHNDLVRAPRLGQNTFELCFNESCSIKRTHCHRDFKSVRVHDVDSQSR